MNDRNGRTQNRNDAEELTALILEALNPDGSLRDRAAFKRLQRVGNGEPVSVVAA